MINALASSSGLAIAIEYKAPSELKLFKTRLRKHPESQFEHLTTSLQTFGCVLPILVDGDLKVIAGEAVLEAAKRLGLAQVPTVRIDP